MPETKKTNFIIFVVSPLIMSNNKQSSLSFSMIIPVYNRPDEIRDLLSSLLRQSYTDFEVIVVEDGSSVLAEKVTRDFMGKLRVKYFYKENSGPGLTRNYGMKKASGNYFIILDSDTVLPENYMQTVVNRLQQNYVDAYGGPDAAADDFTPVQKAINYAMTSFFTTGGIRGKSRSLEKFHPRSFNMGLSKEVFHKTGGFSPMRYGEDIDLSIRILKEGFKTALFQEAFVYHKRRNNFLSFFRQVKHSGEARVALWKKYPDSLKPVHLFPSLFAIGLIFSLLMAVFKIYLPLFLYLLYFLILFFHASSQYKNFKTGFLSAVASFVMLLGYGWGFLQAVFSKKLEN